MPFAAILEVGIDLFRLVLLDVIADTVVAIAGVHDGHVIKHAAVLYPAVGRLDEAVVVDASVAAQRRDQTNVWAFGGLDGTDTAVVRGVNVADFKSGALTRQTTRPKSRETALVGDFRERVRLIHEL